MTEQPTALRLADALENPTIQAGALRHEIAAELRRLHEEVQEQCRINGMGSEREARMIAEKHELLGVLKKIAALKRRDPCKNRSNAGRWVVLNATAELMEKVDAVIAKAEARS